MRFSTSLALCALVAAASARYQAAYYPQDTCPEPFDPTHDYHRAAPCNKVDGEEPMGALKLGHDTDDDGVRNFALYPVRPTERVGGLLSVLRRRPTAAARR
jgi:hypothetical protein